MLAELKVAVYPKPSRAFSFEKVRIINEVEFMLKNYYNGVRNTSEFPPSLAKDVKYLCHDRACISYEKLDQNLKCTGFCQDNYLINDFLFNNLRPLLQRLDDLNEKLEVKP